MQKALATLLLELLQINSITGSENQLIDYLGAQLDWWGGHLTIQPVSANQSNLWITWGEPRIIFCTHLDTVPPVLPITQQNGVIYGRGACDAKGQIVTIYETCRTLREAGETNFGVLLVSGEEIDSIGAKTANQIQQAISRFVVICEPTERKLISAATGMVHFTVRIQGKSAHSGYPAHGINAIDLWLEFMQWLKNYQFPVDKQLGETFFNVGKLSADNPANIISSEVTAQLLFRTTFASHELVKQLPKQYINDAVQLQLQREALPLPFLTVDGFEPGVVSFGSDAPHLSNLGVPLLYGPGSILHAHTDEEQISIAEMVLASNDLQKLYYQLRQLL